MPLKHLIIGTRTSRLARIQTGLVCDSLRDRNNDSVQIPSIQLLELKTTGDCIQNRALREIGGKALFTKELDQALLDGRIDIAVHSAKDLETKLPDGIRLSGALQRGFSQDVLISRHGYTLDHLPLQARMGTSSLRRQAQILARYPHIKVNLLRGNVQKRLQAVIDGCCDFTLLARAGLDRLKVNLMDTTLLKAAILDEKTFIPAAGQGTICITTRDNDDDVHDLIQGISDKMSLDVLQLERTFLKIVGGDCFTPIGLHVHATPAAAHEFTLSVFVAREDGCCVLHRELDFSLKDMRCFNDLAQEVRQWLQTHNILKR